MQQLESSRLDPDNLEGVYDAVHHNMILLVRRPADGFYSVVPLEMDEAVRFSVIDVWDAIKLSNDPRSPIRCTGRPAARRRNISVPSNVVRSHYAESG